MNGKGAMEIDRMAVKISHLDRLLSLTGEIIITAGNMSILQRHMQSQAHLLDRDSTEMIKNATLTANRISSDLHHLVMDIRLIPIKETFLRFRRLVRDLAKKKGRQVNFEIVGEETLVDKTVAEKLYEPLAHQIRNAVDHGLEDPLERKSAGKDPKGQLTLTAYKKEGYTYISAADDGRGLSADKIRAAAVEKGLLTQPAAAALSDADAYQLILRPGFSTAGEATEISGRGVGMDVVKAAVEELGGEVIIETELGRGTVFTYRIPQLSAVNIVDALIIRADDDYYTAPIGNVAATHAFQPGELHSTMNKGRAILYLGALVPLYDIKELLTGRPLDSAEIAESNIPVIIIDGKNGRIALQVTEFIRPQKLVLIPLPEIFSVKGVSGATILGGNQLGLVLDPFELINLATGAHMEASDNVFLSRETVAFEDEAASAPPEAAPAPEAPVQTESMAPPAAEDAEVGGRLAEEFFLEIQGILTELNEDVFQLEKDPENQRRINTIFRHFHSIKGNLIMTGFSALGDFVHKVETVLDRMREKELAVNQEIIDLLLDTVKHLEQALKEIRAGRTYEIDDEDLVGAVEKYRRTEKPPEEPVEEAGEGAFQMSPLSQLLLQSKTMQGANIFQSMIRVKPRFQEPFLAAYLILRRMALLGDVIDAVPPLSRIEQGLVGETIKVLFASRHSLDEVNRFMERQLKRHFDVVEYENLLME